MSTPARGEAYSALKQFVFAYSLLFCFARDTQTSSRFHGSSFRRAVQFNNNVAGDFGGGIAVEGGDVT